MERGTVPRGLRSIYSERGEADIKVVADGVDEISDLVREIQV